MDAIETPPAALTLLLILRDEGQPLTTDELANRSMFATSHLPGLLAGLCMTGPVVCIDIGGEPHWALEWGVKHSSEIR